MQRHNIAHKFHIVTKSLNGAAELFTLLCDQSVGSSEGQRTNRAITSPITLQIWVTAQCAFVWELLLCDYW